MSEEAIIEYETVEQTRERTVCDQHGCANTSDDTTTYELVTEHGGGWTQVGHWCEDCLIEQVEDETVAATYRIDDTEDGITVEKTVVERPLLSPPPHYAMAGDTLIFVAVTPFTALMTPFVGMNDNVTPSGAFYGGLFGAVFWGCLLFLLMEVVV